MPTDDLAESYYSLYHLCHGSERPRHTMMRQKAAVHVSQHPRNTMKWQKAAVHGSQHPRHTMRWQKAAVHGSQHSRHKMRWQKAAVHGSQHPRHTMRWQKAAVHEVVQVHFRSELSGLFRLMLLQSPQGEPNTSTNWYLLNGPCVCRKKLSGPLVFLGWHYACLPCVAFLAVNRRGSWTPAATHTLCTAYQP